MGRYKVTPRHPLPSGVFWSMIAAMVAFAIIVGMTGCSTARAVQPPVESYPLCASEPYDYANVPCVVLSMVEGIEGYVWVTDDQGGPLVFVPMMACAEEDSPGPCVWDTVHRGDGRAGPGVAQFVIVRE